MFLILFSEQYLPERPFSERISKNFLISLKCVQGQGYYRGVEPFRVDEIRILLLVHSQ